MKVSKEDACMAGESALKAEAKEHEEVAEKIEDYDWKAARHHYHVAGRYRLEAKRLRAVYDPRARKELFGSRWA